MKSPLRERQVTQLLELDQRGGETVPLEFRVRKTERENSPGLSRGTKVKRTPADTRTIILLHMRSETFLYKILTILPAEI